MTRDVNERPERWELSDALDRLAQATPVPRSDPGRDRALLAAFDAARGAVAADRLPAPGVAWLRGSAWLGGLAAAAALLIAVGLRPAGIGRFGISGPPAAHGTALLAPGDGTQPDAGEFIPWPGASALPPLESGELVRMQLPVTMLPSLGVAPPASHVTAVTADVVVGQDGLARAVRFVTD